MTRLSHLQWLELLMAVIAGLFVLCLLSGCQSQWGTADIANFTARASFARMADGTTTATASVTYGGPKPFLVDLDVMCDATADGAQVTASAGQGNKADVLKPASSLAARLWAVA